MRSHIEGAQASSLIVGDAPKALEMRRNSAEVIIRLGINNSGIAAGERERNRPLEGRKETARRKRNAPEERTAR